MDLTERVTEKFNKGEKECSVWVQLAKWSMGVFRAEAERVTNHRASSSFPVLRG